jgi:hypothetical protein
MDIYEQRIVDVCAKLKETPEGEEKNLLRKEFWLAAVDAFNETIAGDITTVTGQTIHTPKIEL